MKCLGTYLPAIVVNSGLKVTRVGIDYNLGGKRLKKCSSGKNTRPVQLRVSGNLRIQPCSYQYDREPEG